MSNFDAAVLMAFDMHRQVPTFSPASVAAFLRETIIALPGMNLEETVVVRKLVEKARNADILEELRAEVRGLVDAPQGRSLVLGLIGHVQAVPRIDDGRFRDFVGVNPDTEVSLPDWSVWVFRELQAARAIAEASSAKRRTPRTRTARK